MMVVGRSGLHYGAVAMRVIFLAIFYVETPVQILQQALVLIFLAGFTAFIYLCNLRMNETGRP